MKTSFLCYIEGEGARWQGVCVDFDLTVTGRSFEDVTERLRGAIGSYIADASVEDEPHRSRLLGRRAPLRTRAFWRARVVVAQMGYRLGKMAAASMIRLPAASCPA